MATKADPKPETATQDTVEAQLAAIRAEVATLATLLTAMGKEKVADLQAAAQGMTEDAASQARAALGQAKAEAERMEERLQSHVQEKPLQSLLAAFGLGLIVSLILRR